MLADWRGEPLVVAAARVALAAPVRGVTVVTGADASKVEAVLARLGEARLSIVRNPAWRSGIASSLQAGLRALPADASAALVFLGDMPAIPQVLSHRLLQVLYEGAQAALPECDGAPGHPVAFTKELFGMLQALKGDRGARSMLAAVPRSVHVPVTDCGSLFDIDCRNELGIGSLPRGAMGRSPYDLEYSPAHHFPG